VDLRNLGHETLAPLELILHAAEGGMLTVLHLEPVTRLRPVLPGAALGDQTLETEQLRPDLTPLEGCNEDAIRPAAQELLQVRLAQVQRQIPQVIAVIRRQVERV
jgi:hypothetical protein